MATIYEHFSALTAPISEWELNFLAFALQCLRDLPDLDILA